MNVRSTSAFAGKSDTGCLRRRVRLNTHWTRASDSEAAGRSNANAVTPASEDEDERRGTKIRGNGEAVVDRRSRRRIAGTASTGQRQAVQRTAAPTPAANAAPARPASSPALRRSPIWNAPAVAPPPGTIRPKAFEASCDVTTGNQRRCCSAMRCSLQTPRKAEGFGDDHDLHPEPVDIREASATTRRPRRDSGRARRARLP